MKPLEGDPGYWDDSEPVEFWPVPGRPDMPEVPQGPDVAIAVTCESCRHELSKHVLEGTEFVDHPLDGRLMLREVWSCETHIVSGSAAEPIKRQCPCSVFKSSLKFVRGMVERPPF